MAHVVSRDTLDIMIGLLYAWAEKENISGAVRTKNVPGWGQFWKRDEAVAELRAKTLKPLNDYAFCIIFYSLTQRTEFP